MNKFACLVLFGEPRKFGKVEAYDALLSVYLDFVGDGDALIGEGDALIGDGDALTVLLLLLEALGEAVAVELNVVLMGVMEGRNERIAL